MACWRSPAFVSGYYGAKEMPLTRKRRPITMQQRTYRESELLAEHPYASEHVSADHRLHGGFDVAGRYLSPRTLVRWPAVQAWQEGLRQRGWPLIDASTSLLQRPTFPSFSQQKWLLQQGLGQTLWNSLTVTGVVEARGLALAQIVPPDFQALIVEDIGATTVGHLGRGLLKAHAYDEGGLPGSGLGGHDTMWFAARDLLFGAGAYPMPQVPPSLARPDAARLMPAIAAAYEPLIVLLMNVLMIEIRAEAFFSFCIKVMRDPQLFGDRREAADRAAAMVERIRADEAIHVAYLQTAVSELRSFHLKGVDGSVIQGASVIDPVWQGLVHWHSVTTVDHAQAQARLAIEATLNALPDGQTKLAQFNVLS